MNDPVNLNTLLVPVDHDHEPQVDNGLSATAKIDVIFKKHRERLVEEIGRSTAVLGCVAWLTDAFVLEALAKCHHVSIVVQKEDFLRPDLGGKAWNQNLRRLYGALPSPLLRYSLPGGVSGLNYAGDPQIAPIRCVGNHNRDKRSAWPRMHNKFLVFCDVDQDSHSHHVVTPRRVWTGSYNISANAAASWENAVLIDNAQIADAYAREFAQILTFSEALDWTSDWVTPEYRIGS